MNSESFPRWSMPREAGRRVAARRLDIAYADAYPTLLALARRSFDDPLDAHEAAVEAMAAVWDGGRAVPDAAVRRDWLGRLVDGAGRPPAASPVPQPASAEPVADPAGDPEAGDPEAGDLRAALAGLRRADAELVRMTIIEDRDPGEVARLLGCSERAVQVRLQRARVRLRHELRRAGERIGPAPEPAVRAPDDHPS